ncbi:hypothetical protein F4861DRAFT_126541 [Xylaria intraflava]|nr:hypothetical protein F4861DRAFT_126541 [Xylaria intraflava]
MATFYEQEMLRLCERYDLSPSVRTLLKAFDNFKTHQIDGYALGRQVRLSNSNRDTLLNTIDKCASFMRDHPGPESKHCLTIINICGDMLRHAADKPREVGFHGFEKLPREIRERIYDIYLGNHADAPGVIHRRAEACCTCPNHTSPPYEDFAMIDTKLALTSKTMRQEVFARFYSKRMFHFACGCELGHHLRTNELLKSVVREVKFHWCGRKADLGIRELHAVPNLINLVVLVSKATTKHIMPREEELHRFFGPRRIVHAVYEGLGFDELLAVRGLVEVTVDHADKRKADRRTEAERANLEEMLHSYCVTRSIEDANLLE